MPKQNDAIAGPGFGPDVTKLGSLARETMKSTNDNPTDVIPPKSRKSDSIQEDFNRNCDSCD